MMKGGPVSEPRLPGSKVPRAKMRVRGRQGVLSVSWLDVSVVVVLSWRGWMGVAGMRDGARVRRRGRGMCILSCEVV